MKNQNLLDRIKFPPSETLWLVLSSILFVILLYPLLICTLLPILFYRWIIIKIAQRDPRCGNIIDGIGAIYMARKPYEKPLTTLVGYFPLVHKPNTERVINIARDKLFSGDIPVYPELAQRVVSKFGYSFWYNVDNFDVANHVRYWNEDDPEKVMNATELQSLVQTLAKAPFDPTKSPWELVLVPNFIDEESDPESKGVLIFKCHHGLLDGLSFLKMLKRVSSNPKKFTMVRMTSPTLTKWQRLSVFFLLVFTGPYHMIKLTRFSNDKNECVERSIEEFSGKVRTKFGPLIPTVKIKSVAKKWKVRMTTVITAMVVGAISKFVTRKTENEKIGKIHLVMPYPLPNHPDDKLTNHWTMVKIPVMIDSMDLGKTLRCIDDEFTRLRYSVAPLAVKITNQILGSLPCVLIPKSDGLMSNMCVFTNIPGPPEKMDIFGYDVLGFGLTSNSMPGFAFGTGCFGYDGNFRFTCGSEVSNFTEQEDVDFFMDSLFYTFRQLENNCDDNDN